MQFISTATDILGELSKRLLHLEKRYHVEWVDRKVTVQTDNQQARSFESGGINNGRITINDSKSKSHWTFDVKPSERGGYDIDDNNVSDKGIQTTQIVHSVDTSSAASENTPRRQTPRRSQSKTPESIIYVPPIIRHTQRPVSAPLVSAPPVQSQNTTEMSEASTDHRPNRERDKCSEYESSDSSPPQRSIGSQQQLKKYENDLQHMTLDEIEIYRATCKLTDDEYQIARNVHQQKIDEFSRQGGEIAQQGLETQQTQKDEDDDSLNRRASNTAHSIASSEPSSASSLLHRSETPSSVPSQTHSSLTDNSKTNPASKQDDSTPDYSSEFDSDSSSTQTPIAQTSLPTTSAKIRPNSAPTAKRARQLQPHSLFIPPDASHTRENTGTFQRKTARTWTIDKNKIQKSVERQPILEVETQQKKQVLPKSNPNTSTANKRDGKGFHFPIVDDVQPSVHNVNDTEILPHSEIEETTQASRTNYAQNTQKEATETTTATDHSEEVTWDMWGPGTGEYEERKQPHTPVVSQLLPQNDDPPLRGGSIRFVGQQRPQTKEEIAKQTVPKTETDAEKETRLAIDKERREREREMESKQQQLEQEEQRNLQLEEAKQLETFKTKDPAAMLKEIQTGAMEQDLQLHHDNIQQILLDWNLSVQLSPLLREKIRIYQRRLNIQSQIEDFKKNIEQMSKDDLETKIKELTDQNIQTDSKQKEQLQMQQDIMLRMARRQLDLLNFQITMENKTILEIKLTMVSLKDDEKRQIAIKVKHEKEKIQEEETRQKEEEYRRDAEKQKEEIEKKVSDMAQKFILELQEMTEENITSEIKKLTKEQNKPKDDRLNTFTMELNEATIKTKLELAGMELSKKISKRQLEEFKASISRMTIAQVQQQIEQLDKQTDKDKFDIATQILQLKQKEQAALDKKQKEQQAALDKIKQEQQATLDKIKQEQQVSQHYKKQEKQTPQDNKHQEQQAAQQEEAAPNTMKQKKEKEETKIETHMVQYKGQTIEQLRRQKALLLHKIKTNTYKTQKEYEEDTLRYTAMERLVSNRSVRGNNEQFVTPPTWLSMRYVDTPGVCGRQSHKDLLGGT